MRGHCCTAAAWTSVATITCSVVIVATSWPTPTHAQTTCATGSPAQLCAAGLSCPVGSDPIPGALCGTCMCGLDAGGLLDEGSDVQRCCTPNGV